MAATSTFTLLLAGVGDDEGADHALVAAERIRAVRDTRLDLVHCLRKHPRTQPEEIELALETAKRLSRRLERLEREHDLAAGTFTRRLKVEFGDPGKVLAAKAAEGPADAIFLGPHGMKGLVDLSSTIRDVLEHTRCCVWLQPCPVTPIGHVLVAFDASPASLQALELGRRVAALVGARMTLLHCTAGSGPLAEADQAVVLAELRGPLEDFEWNDVPHEFLIVAERPLQAILDRQDQADLICVGTRGLTGLKRVLHGSLASQVALAARRPVLVAPRPA